MLRVLFLNSSGTISANQVENTFADTLSRIMRRQLSHIVFKFGFIKNQSVKFYKGWPTTKIAAAPFTVAGPEFVVGPFSTMQISERKS